MSIHRYANQKLRARLIAGDEPLWLRRHCRRQYIVSSVLAAPPYISPADFKHLVARRNALTARTGVPHVLDHAVPITHDKVCGLNVPWNIEVVPQYANAAKSNRWCDVAIGWFNEPEQFSFIF